MVMFGGIGEFSKNGYQMTEIFWNLESKKVKFVRIMMKT